MKRDVTIDRNRASRTCHDGRDNMKFIRIAFNMLLFIPIRIRVSRNFNRSILELVECDANKSIEFAECVHCFDFLCMC